MALRFTQRDNVLTSETSQLHRKLPKKSLSQKRVPAPQRLAFRNAERGSLAPAHVCRSHGKPQKAVATPPRDKQPGGEWPLRDATSPASRTQKLLDRLGHKGH
eukprot:7382582-Prymnesium_polylepis.1